MIIKNLSVRKGEKTILDNLDLELHKGRIHIIMGPNGSGKSTLSNTIVGHFDCEVLGGAIDYEGVNILEQEVEERALQGIYLAPQYPPVIEGLSHAAFLKEVVNIKLEKQGKEPLDDFQFLKQLRNIADKYGFDAKAYPRQSLNQGFSGGEKKRNEILQINLLSPDFIILDEIDSGLDIEAMKKIAVFINEFLSEDKTIVVITHYPQFASLLDNPIVHILKSGKISQSGDVSLVDKVLQDGFGEFA